MLLVIQGRPAYVLLLSIGRCLERQQELCNEAEEEAEADEDGKLPWYALVASGSSAEGCGQDAGRRESDAVVSVVSVVSVLVCGVLVCGVRAHLPTPRRGRRRWR